jgi:hypothetical protein
MAQGKNYERTKGKPMDPSSQGEIPILPKSKNFTQAQDAEEYGKPYEGIERRSGRPPFPSNLRKQVAFRRYGGTG